MGLRRFHLEACSRRGVAVTCFCATAPKHLAVLTRTRLQLTARVARFRHHDRAAPFMVRKAGPCLHEGKITPLRGFNEFAVSANAPAGGNGTPSSPFATIQVVYIENLSFTFSSLPPTICLFPRHVLMSQPTRPLSALAAWARVCTAKGRFLCMEKSPSSVLVQTELS